MQIMHCFSNLIIHLILKPTKFSVIITLHFIASVLDDRVRQSVYCGNIFVHNRQALGRIIFSSSNSMLYTISFEQYVLVLCLTDTTSLIIQYDPWIHWLKSNSRIISSRGSKILSRFICKSEYCFQKFKTISIISYNQSFTYS